MLDVIPFRAAVTPLIAEGSAVAGARVRAVSDESEPSPVSRVLDLTHTILVITR